MKAKAGDRVRVKDTCSFFPGRSGTVTTAREADVARLPVRVDNGPECFFYERELAPEEHDFAEGVTVDTVGALVDLLSHAPRGWPLAVNYDGSGRVAVCGLSDSCDEPIVRLSIFNADKCEWAHDWPLSHIGPKE